jgi:hypothetical protein
MKKKLLKWWYFNDQPYELVTCFIAMMFFIYMNFSNYYWMRDYYFYLALISGAYFFTFLALFPFRIPYQPEKYIYHFTNKKSFDLINDSKTLYGVSDGRVYFTDHSKNAQSGRYFGKNCTHAIYCVPDTELFEASPGWRWSYGSLKRRKGEWRTKVSGDVSFSGELDGVLHGNRINYISKEILNPKVVKHLGIYKKYAALKIILRMVIFEPIMFPTYFTLTLIYVLFKINQKHNSTNSSIYEDFLSFLAPFSGLFIVGALIFLWFPIQYTVDGFMRSRFNK